MFDINAFLELIMTNSNVNVEIKLFATLSQYIMLKKVNVAEIITYNSLYDKICTLLSNCPPRKASVLLNFLSALLYVDDEDCEGKSLVVYAKNMIRSSGCLATMCEIFTNCMMNQDVWRSLCRCLAETCRNMEANQSYCTHLVPMCIQRCSQRNIEVLLVLQSLLQNHERNVNLFIESNGISLFKRELLHHDSCLQLLNTLVQSSERFAEIVDKTEAKHCLIDFLKLYGPESQLGQWATIILYHMPGIKGTCVMPFPKQQIIDEENLNPFIAEEPNLHASTDTTGFFQNVMKEIMHCGLLPAKSENTYKNNFFLQTTLNNNQVTTNKVWTQNVSPTFNGHKLQIDAFKSSHVIEDNRSKKTSNLSFSFLYNENIRRYQNVSMSASRTTKPIKRPQSLMRSVSNSVHINKKSELSESSNQRDNFSRHDTFELSSFEPKFVSTPKKHKEIRKSSVPSVQNSTSMTLSKSMYKHNNMSRMRSKRYLSKISKYPKRHEQTTSVKEVHRSISGRFFEAVNESCTTLVKTIKNIFRPKDSTKETEDKYPTQESEITRSCSYSFTNYMRKRDAILKTECTKKCNIEADDFSMEMSNSCSTCNDTIVLQQKLATDEHLRRTIRKLKLGINLYGCDFKKISKQLWPHQSYMTPTVLYNLYRKLIRK